MINLEEVLAGVDPESDWLVEGIIHGGQLVCLAGDAGVGKSVLAHNLSFSVAVPGLDFLGFKTNHGKVLYFDEENSWADITQYLRWTWRGLGKPDITVLQENLLVEHFELETKGKARYSYIRSKIIELQPLLVVIDTATPACGIQDENDNAEATHVIQELRKAQSCMAKPPTFLILKHAKFSHEVHEGRTIRGAKVWKSATDGLIFHVAVTGRPKKDGLRDTYLIPDKTRAYGLRQKLDIIPDWVGEDPNARGIKLSRRTGT